MLGYQYKLQTFRLSASVLVCCSPNHVMKVLIKIQHLKHFKITKFVERIRFYSEMELNKSTLLANVMQYH